MTNLFTAYFNDREKYSAVLSDNFEWKLMLFHERCDQANIPENDKQRAFSIMLVGRA